MNAQESPTARLLVVDDQPANIQVVGSMLGRFGYEIVPATSGEQALKRLRLRRMDLILLDVLMEGMDGFEVCRQVWPLRIGRIFRSFFFAADDKDLIVRAFQAGGVDYVTKPFNQAELVSRVRTHLSLKAARDRLKQLAEDKDELLGILAHDCKNHLGGIHMTAQLLHERVQSKGDARLLQMVENIERSSGLMVDFVREFLANAAADHGLTLEPKALCLRTVASRTIRDHQDAARRKQMSIRGEWTDDDATVNAAPEALDQVLDNLLSNAVKFSPPGREIVVGVRPAGDDVECYVQDQGPGFSEEDKVRLFRRYTRLSARPTGGELSTGLGLSIIKKLVDAMGGQLTCESVSGMGATFFVRFPRATGGR